jgi:uncharacterized HAD superfamily protein/adenine/guanine phosphoribosyltransferase-like PRPP-binding protein
MNYKSYNELSQDIRKHLPRLHEYNFDLIVGLPRSGLTPANIISLYLNVHCTDLNSLINNIELKTGRTRKSNNTILKYAQDAKTILLVDDSICTGGSLESDLRLIPSELRSRIKTCAIYSSKKERYDVDLYLEHIAMPRVFEWNIFHHPILDAACLDIDGVLCEDPTKEQNDDGEQYVKFILNASPLFIPSAKVFALVTSRLEKYRKHTETWLNKYNVEYEHLIMLNLPSKEERQRLGVHAKHKAKFYKKSDAVLFIESEYNQSVEITNITNKPVYCVDENIMLCSGVHQFKRKTKIMLREKIISKIPIKVKNLIKRLRKTWR